MTFIISRNQSIFFFIFIPFFFSPREKKIIYVPINHLSLPNFRCIRSLHASSLSDINVHHRLELPLLPRYTSA